MSCDSSRPFITFFFFHVLMDQELRRVCHMSQSDFLHFTTVVGSSCHADMGTNLRHRHHMHSVFSSSAEVHFKPSCHNLAIHSTALHVVPYACLWIHPSAIRHPFNVPCVLFAKSLPNTLPLAVLLFKFHWENRSIWETRKSIDYSDRRSDGNDRQGISFGFFCLRYRTL